MILITLFMKHPASPLLMGSYIIGLHMKADFLFLAQSMRVGFGAIAPNQLAVRGTSNLYLGVGNKFGASFSPLDLQTC